MGKQLTKSNTVALKELRENMSEYIDRVDRGETITVLRRSEPVFKLTPVDSEEGWETVIDFTKINKKGVDAKDVLKALKKLHGEA